MWEGYSGGAWASGNLFQDTVAFPNALVSDNDHVFGIADAVAPGFLTELNNGILGMSFSMNGNQSIVHQ